MISRQWSRAWLLVVAATLSVELVCAPSAKAQTPQDTTRIVTVPGSGRAVAVRVFNRELDRTNEFLAYDERFQGGAFVAAGASSITGIVVGPDAGGGPHVKVFGFDGALRSQFMAYAPEFRGGVRVAIANVDGDGPPEIVTAPGPGGGPHIRVFRLDGSLVAEFMAFDLSFAGGAFVAGHNLLDEADASEDIVVGAGPGGGPHVRAFDIDCAGGGCVSRPVGGGFFAFDPTFRGGVTVAAEDIAEPRGAEVIVAAGPGGGPHVRTFTRTGQPIGPDYMAYDTAFSGGVFIAGTFVGEGETMTGAGAGGGAHVRLFHDSTPDPTVSFLAYETSFRGGVRLDPAVDE